MVPVPVKPGLILGSGLYFFNLIKSIKKQIIIKKKGWEIENDNQIYPQGLRFGLNLLGQPGTRGQHISTEK